MGGHLLRAWVSLASGTGANPGWSRRRALALGAGVMCLSGVLGLGLLLSVLSFTGLTGIDHLHPGAALSRVRPHALAVAGPHWESARQLAEQKDALAARPMPGTSNGASPPPELSTRPGNPPLAVPTGHGMDPTGVITGYPHTPAGAIAQMAAIDQAAMQSASLPGVRAVITAWAAPGGPTSTSWSGVSAMRTMLESGDLSGAGSPRLSISFTPAAGLIKGNVGPDFVLGCVDFTVEVTLQQTATVAAADCERMLWQGGRWVIGPGKEPAVAPSDWPDTDEAIHAGWRDLTHD